MTAYATVAQLETEMRTTFSETDAAYAESVLERIGGYLAQVVDIDPEDDAQAENLMYASLYMARRIMERQQASDISSMTTTAGVYSETLTYAQPYGTDNLAKLLKASGYAGLLGTATGYIGSIEPSIGGVCDA